MKIALVQQHATTDKAQNVQRGLEAVREASGQGAQLKRRVLQLASLLLCASGLMASQESPQATPAPNLPQYNWKACPFEGCQYGPWTARKPAIVYDTWKNSRHPMTRLGKGDKVTGLTGLVITYEPGVIRMDRDLPEYGLHRGDTILTYTYRGEGVSAVWFKGHYDPEFDISFAKWPDGGGCGGDHCAATYVNLGKKAWWAQVKLSSGHTGWVNMDNAPFAGTDALE